MASADTPQHVVDMVSWWSGLISIILMVVLAGIAIYDAVTAIAVGSDATVSAVVRAVAERHPILPLLVGIVIGHIFWGR